MLKIQSLLLLTMKQQIQENRHLQHMLKLNSCLNLMINLWFNCVESTMQKQINRCESTPQKLTTLTKLKNYMTFNRKFMVQSKCNMHIPRLAKVQNCKAKWFITKFSQKIMSLDKGKKRKYFCCFFGRMMQWFLRNLLDSSFFGDSAEELHDIIKARGQRRWGDELLCYLTTEIVLG